MLRRQASRKVTARNLAGASDISNATLRPRGSCALSISFYSCVGREHASLAHGCLLCVVVPELTNLIKSAMVKSTLLSTCKSKFEGGILNIQQRDLE